AKVTNELKLSFIKLANGESLSLGRLSPFIRCECGRYYHEMYASEQKEIIDTCVKQHGFATQAVKCFAPLVFQIGFGSERRI
ncbi:MAG TPA: hypothetical protein VEY10_07875, partial [Flavisolibacter sp.]|nr:hypothetical protein [Flavisolibacter sp.]